MEELIAQGCTILFPSQFGFLEYSHTVALRHPEVAFYSLPITDYAGGNFSIIHGEVPVSYTHLAEALSRDIVLMR